MTAYVGAAGFAARYKGLDRAARYKGSDASLLPVVLGALAGAGRTFTAGASAGTVIGSITGKTAGSTITVSDNRLAVSSDGMQLLVGVSASSASTINATLTETLAGATGSPKDTAVSVTVSAAAAEAETTAFLARMSAQPSNARASVYDALYKDLKAAGVLSKLDGLVLLPAHTDQARRLNLINSAYDLTASNPTPFVADRATVGDAATQVFNTNFNPATAAGKFQRDSAFVGEFCLSDFGANIDDVGNVNTTIRARFAGNIAFRLNQAATTSVPIESAAGGQVGGSSVGWTWASRDNASTVRYGRDDAVLGTYSAASVAPDSTSFLVSGGRSVTNPGFSPRAVGAFAWGAALTNAEAIALGQAIKKYMLATALYESLTLTATTAQTLNGISFELQSDSIEGDGGGIQNTNNTAIPTGLSTSERTRFADEIVKGFYRIRTAQGLYTRRFSSDQKVILGNRVEGTDAAIKAMCERAGTFGLTFTHWSPAPFWKRNTVSGTEYRGSTLAIPDATSDPTGYNTYCRRLLQGGTLDHPDKATDPTGYAAWMDAFATSIVTSMETQHQNVYRVTGFCLQNEPVYPAAAGSATYPQCFYTDQQMYDALKAVVPKIRASSILSTWAGQPNRVTILSDDMNGQNGKGSTLIKADSALLAEIDAWSWHRISEASQDANWVYTNRFTLTSNANGKPIICTESEDFDPQVDPAQGRTYMTKRQRFGNHALQPLKWMKYAGSPEWYPIHVAKNSNGPTLEREGRAMTSWRPVGAGVAPEDASLAEGAFTTVPVNFNAWKPFRDHMPAGSTRVTLLRANVDIYDTEFDHMAWVKPNGKAVIIVASRSTLPAKFGINVAGKTFTGLRYDLSAVDQPLGSQAGALALTVPPYAVEVWAES